MPGKPLRELPAFAPEPWQMSYGERAVLEGVLQMVKPRIAIEIGRAEGGSLKRIAAHSEQVISLDLVEPWPEVSELSNVTALSGDSHALLPQELDRLAASGETVDFVLVDGDHSAEGVRQDIEQLLEADAIAHTVILIHDTLNQDVRRGVEAVDYEAHQKVSWGELDFVPGYVARLPERLGECWGGIGLLIADDSGAFRSGGPLRNEILFEQPKLVWPVAEWLHGEGAVAAERLTEVTLVPDEQLRSAQQRVVALEAELDRHRGWLESMKASASWRLTAPLRTAKRRAEAARRRRRQRAGLGGM